MGRIDLSMRVGEWAQDNKNLKAQVINRLCCYGVAYRRAGIQPYGDTHTIRQLCQEDCYSIVQNIPGLKYIDLATIIIALNKDGLSIEMTDEGLAEYEGKPAPKADNIDWEQRRWELATMLFVRYQNLTFTSAIKFADDFIWYYQNPQIIRDAQEQPLNKEK